MWYVKHKNKGREIKMSKQVIATMTYTLEEMNRQEYNDFRGWDLPKDENGLDKGFKAIDQNGHINWLPEAVVSKFKDPNTMTFGDAIEMLKLGKKVARKGWNGKGMWLILVPGSPNIKPIAGTPYSNAGLTSEIQILPHIDMYTTDSTGRRAMLPGWVASQTDMLSNDWVVIE